MLLISMFFPLIGGKFFSLCFYFLESPSYYIFFCPSLHFGSPNLTYTSFLNYFFFCLLYRLNIIILFVHENFIPRFLLSLIYVILIRLYQELLHSIIDSFKSFLNLLIQFCHFLVAPQQLFLSLLELSFVRSFFEEMP